MLLTPELCAALHANHAAHRAAADRDDRHDPVPVVKLFNPVGAATWVATELYDDGDTLFGLADLGFGCPELGVFSLAEIAGILLPLGLGIETRHRLCERPAAVGLGRCRPPPRLDHRRRNHASPRCGQRPSDPRRGPGRMTRAGVSRR